MPITLLPDRLPSRSLRIAMSRSLAELYEMSESDVVEGLLLPAPCLFFIIRYLLEIIAFRLLKSPLSE